MGKKLTGWKTKGMNRDLSVSAFNPEFAFENRNLRLATNEDNTLMSWVNEKGTQQVTILNGGIQGTPIGTAVIGNLLIIFTHSNSESKDRIYKLHWVDTEEAKMMISLLFEGDLKFSISNPLETLVSYESDSIQKVYWVDGKNQPRVINVAVPAKKENRNYINEQFDFIHDLKLNETVTVQKILGGNGMFAPGVIQYAFTYYNKHGQESNIFYTSPLLYISHRERGASPEDKVDNAFKITVDGIDSRFDCLRIYSIQRTSINGTPICKRIQDIVLKNSANEILNKVSYTDTGTSGDSIDPTELLYKGGNEIIAGTIEQKDNTLFLGNLKTLNNDIRDLKNAIEDGGVTVDGKNKTRKIFPTVITENDYIYSNQLTAYKDSDKTESIPCAGFKRGDAYRCGVQFQHKSGKWSNPVYIKNERVTGKPQEGITEVDLPRIEGKVKSSLITTLQNKGYVKVRAVVVYPSMQDRLAFCQGIICPTLYTEKHKENKDLHAQSSWFFRPRINGEVTTKGTVSPCGNNGLKYTLSNMKANDGGTTVNYVTNDSYQNTYYRPDEEGNEIRQVEIQGDYKEDNRFKIGTDIVTFHSPDLEFDTQMAVTDFSSFYYRKIGTANFAKTFSDINIQTETPTASSGGAGFIHKSFVDDGVKGIVSGLFYDDFVVNDDNSEKSVGIGAYEDEISSCKWMVYLWNKTGSLNNDINRPADKGIATAKLKKKIISNLRYATTSWDDGYSNEQGPFTTTSPQLFSSDQTTIVKLDDNIYRGNIDTVLNPDFADGMYFVFNDKDIQKSNVKTDFISSNEVWWKSFYDQIKDGEKSTTGSLWVQQASGSDIWDNPIDDFFSSFNDCALKKELVRMKYKSTPHLVFKPISPLSWANDESLPIGEIYRYVEDNHLKDLFGGESEDALRENIWIPCGEPVRLDKNGENDVSFYYDYGDTYYQRWDCLKTYAFTPEDENQVVEIGSFMLETKVNIDGRYDRNRGQLSNLNMSPINFNLLNPVYSQINNFFTYRIMGDDYYKDNEFPNQVTWSKTKESGADVDMWTNVTLASVLELDGDKGALNRIERFNNQLIAFQDTGTSQILYNENTQVTTEQGVPVEIGNSKKVNGKRYLSDTIGCSNKLSIVSTPVGIYFMDSYNKSIFLFNGQFNNLSGSLGFNAWSKQNIPAVSSVWNPVDFDAFVSYYDKLNQDVLFINKDMALAYSERLGTFTSFYDYGKAPYFVNLEDTGIWINQSQIENEGQLADSTYYLWKHQGGADYCKFFDVQHPYWTVLIGNPEPQMDKVFTNLEFRACVDGDGSVENEKFTPYLPFDYLETWNEYQHGLANIGIRSGHDLFKHHPRNLSEPKAFDASLIRKFRTWRCDIPRSNASLERDEGLNCYRKDVRPQDRMRNPWLYLKLMKNANSSNKRAEIHDVVMTYFV